MGGHSPQRRRSRRALTALAALGSALAIAACGSSSTARSDRAASAFAQSLKFSDCMRSHGVTNFPDPGSGGGIHIQAGSGVNPASPAFDQAQSACFKLMPGGGPGKRPPSPQAKAQLLRTSECMRAHGVNGFPDPTTAPPTNIEDYSMAIGRGGVFLAVPKTIDPSSPTFKQAAQACNFGPGPGAKATPVG
jgi:hypothetical protein